MSFCNKQECWFMKTSACICEFLFLFQMWIKLLCCSSKMGSWSIDYILWKITSFLCRENQKNHLNNRKRNSLIYEEILGRLLHPSYILLSSGETCNNEIFTYSTSLPFFVWRQKNNSLSFPIKKYIKKQQCIPKHLRIACF